MSATEQVTGLTEASRRIAAIRDEIQTEMVRHEEEVKTLDRRLFEAVSRRDLILAGATLDVVELAETVLEVKGRENVGRGEGRSVVAKAIRDLANGAPTLRTMYMGTKDYDRWAGQEEGGSYGSSPSYGRTIFYIGLVEECRDRLSHWIKEPGRPGKRENLEGRQLTEAETDAAIAYLHAIVGTLARV